MSHKHLDEASNSSVLELKILMRKIDYLIDVEHQRVKGNLQKRFLDCFANQQKKIEEESIRRNLKTK